MGVGQEIDSFGFLSLVVGQFSDSVAQDLASIQFVAFQVWVWHGAGFDRKKIKVRGVGKLETSSGLKP